MFIILQKTESNAIVFIPANSPDLMDYIYSGYLEQFKGTKNQCLDWIDNYYLENDIPEEERILIKT